MPMIKDAIVTSPKSAGVRSRARMTVLTSPVSLTLQRKAIAQIEPRSICRLGL
jgi:hypothetical protein